MTKGQNDDDFEEVANTTVQSLIYKVEDRKEQTTAGKQQRETAPNLTIETPCKPTAGPRFDKDTSASLTDADSAGCTQTNVDHWPKYAQTKKHNITPIVLFVSFFF